MGLVWLLIVGFIVGGIARFLVPGKDPMPWWQTILLGIAGSYIGGFIFSLLPGGSSPLDFSTTNFFGSVIGAIVGLLIYRRVRG